MTTVLYGAAAEGRALADAIEAAAMDGGCALLTAPSAYHVARVEGRDCMTPDGPVDLRAVYEARVFTPDRELRWVERGYAVLLTEDESLLPPSFPERLDALAAIDVLDHRYLVWGEATRGTPGWTALRSNRVPTIAVPAATGQSRVRLAAREYVAVEPEHGNAYVAEERLIGFEPYRPEGAA
ncbi:CRISPR-associated protein (TIGR03984 family) [Thermocatellispora tengchongensis]|uniref:CRISPR-associated protein (TIGR03984 family) n=1 Tax=Thermocatellispora tengchongensis TaxID=1073253 RepID=A0A840PFH5_9ACTN|nr:CRISPR-associated protein Csx19 [Thermocatellispora tengchongensis]MBB5136210.1 CRISPR-associated protein (TIGR03984 family) [Thermocatellispora tengchongensis]